jgi:hypothetical protein
MADISIIEFAVYGFMAYGAILMLMISSIKDTPTSKSQSFTRAMYLIPGIICAGILAGSGELIILDTETITTSTQVLDSADSVTMLTSSSTINNSIQLQDSIWILVHVMIFLILTFHVIMQSLMLLTKTD